MKVFAIDRFHFDLPAGHRFPLEKYRLLREAVERELVPPVRMTVPMAASDEQLRLAHTAEYVDRAVRGSLTEREVRRMGLPWSPELVERSRRSVGSTIEGARTALEEGIAVSLSGGTHHAGSDHGEGFCVFNDAAVALKVLKAERRINRAVVLDLDVHQGDGTAEILRMDPALYTLSIHAANNFPFRKIPGDMDIALPDGLEDADYLGIVEEAAGRALALSNPDLAIYLAGADPYAGDRLGRLKVTRAGLQERDEIVLGLLRERGIPVVVVMAGGYGRDISDTVAIHLQTVTASLEFWKSNYSACG
jgi:acetoin utilization deacetylase AcuC-like enzyme